MKHPFLSVFAAAIFSAGSFCAMTLTADASEASTTSKDVKMLQGTWEQGADRTIGEAPQAVRVTAMTETYNADGTADVSYRITILGDALPADLRTYDFDITNNWRLEGDKIYTEIVSGDVTYIGENPRGNAIAASIEKDTLKAPEAFTTLVSVNAENYIARMPDNTLFTMNRK